MRYTELCQCIDPVSACMMAEHEWSTQITPAQKTDFNEYISQRFQEQATVCALKDDAAAMLAFAREWYRTNIVCYAEAPSVGSKRKRL